MAEDPGIDQETFDRLIEEGQPERVARAKAKAAAARKSRQAEASSGNGAAADGEAGGGGGGETPEQVQERVFKELVDDGAPERVARAKAKAAAARAEKAAEKSSEPAKQPAGAKSGGGGGAAAGNGAANRAGDGTGIALTPEQRQQRVAAALAGRAEGGGPHERTGGTETKYAGQEHTHRLLAMVPPTGIQQIRGKQDDKAYTWPHLLTAEFICLMAVTAFLFVFSALAPAPLRELANPNVTPNPSKAPWYFLGLQEMLRYWHPMVAGVTIPLLLGPLALVAIPYLDRNPSMRPERRRFAYTLFTMFLVASAALTLSGSFFRGPGFNWTWPWADGIWFTL
ncbi:MAG: menaquinol-cytochrome c reductase cytochrome b subunit [Actinobacteria bacterium]|nr:menaquinol-cytochrome c reductase cytochrome b subunit [Actinomycetota bacterium]